MALSFDDFESELAKENICFRENFTCCGTCGHYEIKDEKKDTDIGYAFYHQQDTERGAETGSCFLAYGSFKRANQDLLQIANTINDVAQRCGLNPNWNGNTNQRIGITANESHFQKLLRDMREGESEGEDNSDEEKD
eukprot:TRINITY_DN1216_c0_g2_i1.p1 TRINITY_DN1216_c0_g2~~TRINITY_DN1216_c0_g2_i1.p1  ORF type:complete len:137 (+),score=38.52 TRINITY_DN1216_c0_g2_i1:63-473(+)